MWVRLMGGAASVTHQTPRTSPFQMKTLKCMYLTHCFIHGIPGIDGVITDRPQDLVAEVGLAGGGSRVRVGRVGNKDELIG